MEWVPFERSHTEAAAKLLSARHTEERKRTPSLQRQFEEPVHAKRAVEALLERNNISGIAAFRNSELIGYMIGRLETDKLRGRHTWVDYAGTAIAAGESAELYRDMYAAAASEWVKVGSFKHYVLAPGGEAAAMDGWMRLGFAYEQVHAVLTIPTNTGLPEPQSSVPIRLAKEYDEDAVRRMSTLIMEHQAGAPVWAPAFIEDRLGYQEGYVQLIKDSLANFWVASLGQEIVGFQVFFHPEDEESDTMMPDCCITLGVGATVPSARGKGIGTALLKAGLEHASNAGFTHCMADWRITNLESSRFWPKQGFIPYAYRLVRHIDPRAASTGGEG